MVDDDPPDPPEVPPDDPDDLGEVYGDGGEDPEGPPQLRAVPDPDVPRGTEPGPTAKPRANWVKPTRSNNDSNARAKQELGPKKRTGRREMEVRLRKVDELLMAQGRWRTKHALMHDTDLGWHLTRPRSEQLIREVLVRRAEERAKQSKPEDLEELRCRFDVISEQAYAAGQYGAASHALRTRAELDGYVGRLQVQVGDQHLHQHVHVGGPALPTIAAIDADLEAMTDDEVRVLRKLLRTQPALEAGPDPDAE